MHQESIDTIVPRERTRHCQVDNIYLESSAGPERLLQSKQETPSWVLIEGPETSSYKLFGKKR